jgi:hypothetical protein
VHASARAAAAAVSLSRPRAVHKAAHLKNISLSGPTDTYCTLSVGRERFSTTMANDGGAHPEWEQAFYFLIGGGINGAGVSLNDRPGTSSSLDNDIASDGSLHMRIWDNRSSPIEGGGKRPLGRLDINLAQLMAEPKSLDAQWLPMKDDDDFSVDLGFVCITARFEGIRVPMNSEEAAEHAAQRSAAAASKILIVEAPLADGEHSIPELANGSYEARMKFARESLAAAAAIAESLSPMTSPRRAQSDGPMTPRGGCDTFLTSRPGTSIIASTPLPPTSAYFASASENWPTPSPRPVAPGYPTDQQKQLQLAQFAQQTLRAFESPPASPSPSDSPAGSPSHADMVAASAASAVPPLFGPQAGLVTAYDVRHAHILQLIPRGAGGRFLCASCNGEGYASAYHCTEGCSPPWNLHEHCLQERAPVSKYAHVDPNGVADPDAPGPPPDMRIDARHPHPLTWSLANSDHSFSCNGCGGGGIGCSWHCRACGFDLHPECMR